MKCGAQHDHQHGKPDPMRVRVHLAYVIVFGLAICVERGPGLRPLMVGCVGERLCQRTAQVIERLMFDKNGIVQSVEHAKRSKRQPADYEQPGRTAHAAPPAMVSMSSLPV